MTSFALSDTAERYASLLERWSQGSSEEVLERAYELGREAWGQGIGVVQLVLLHHDSLARLLGQLEAPTEVERIARQSGLLAAECVSVFEMAMRGFQEANAVLEESNRRLEEANRELDAFSYAVSHDLRAPLRTIDGFSQAIAEDWGDHLPPAGLDHLRHVRSATQRMNELIEDLLRLSHVARVELKREPVDLASLAVDVAAELTRRSPGRTLRWTVEPGIAVSGDRQLLRIVLENLLGNAWKFTGTVLDPSIHVGQSRSEGSTTVFIRDNGVGFDSTRSDALFRPYQRLHSDSRFPGTGIGLATAQRIIERHGGRIWAESTPGEGATFFFSIPS